MEKKKQERVHVETITTYLTFSKTTKFKYFISKFFKPFTTFTFLLPLT